jgi:hypothetical protein
MVFQSSRPQAVLLVKIFIMAERARVWGVLCALATSIFFVKDHRPPDFKWLLLIMSRRRAST